MPSGLISYVLNLVLLASYGIQNACAAQDEQQLLAAEKSRPNILFVLTDDQDLHMDSLSYMPYVKKHLIDRGTSFTRHYCTVALCCPSRVSMWTGKAAHNTNVTDINPPYGGYPKFISQGFNDHYVPVWLQAAGYNTYYVGKLFNAQSIYNYDSPHAAGWTGSDFLLDPYTYRYLNATFQRNFDEPVSYEGRYATDVLAEKAHGFLDDAIDALQNHGKPFFLTVAPTAPHSDVNIKQKVIHGNFSENSNVQSPPIPAERHKHLFEDVVVPRTPNFNPEIHGGASWISRLPRQNQTNIDFNDHFYRNRLRSLQAVDEMVDSLMTRLSEAGVLENTYVFYSTDNGYAIGQHRRQPGKQCAFEEDINVPFIVRGPGIPEGVDTDLVTTHTDLAPTFLALAEASLPANLDLDGQAMPLTEAQIRKNRLVQPESQAANEDWSQEHINVEMWGIIMSEGIYGSILYPNHTYKALRIAGPSYNLLYTIWCSGEHELYDMTTDPYQLVNLYDGNLTSSNAAPLLPVDRHILNPSVPFPEHLASINDSDGALDHEPRIPNSHGISTLTPLIHRLDALLMVLKTCEARQCTHPWESLFPEGEVRCLSDALNVKYDHYFASKLERVRFDRCEKGYIAESEGPMWNEKYAYAMTEEMAYD